MAVHRASFPLVLFALAVGAAANLEPLQHCPVQRSVLLQAQSATPVDEAAACAALSAFQACVIDLIKDVRVEEYPTLAQPKLDELSNLSAANNCSDVFAPPTVQPLQPTIKSGDGNLDLRVEGEKDIRFSRRSVDSVSVFDVLTTARGLSVQFTALEERCSTMQETITQAFRAMTQEALAQSTTERDSVNDQLQRLATATGLADGMRTVLEGQVRDLEEVIEGQVRDLKGELAATQNRVDTTRDLANEALAAVRRQENDLGHINTAMGLRVAALEKTLTDLETRVTKSEQCALAGKFLNSEGKCGSLLPTQSAPAKDCLTLRKAGIDKDGPYWLRPDPGQPAHYLYCDMTREGGGWTLVAKARYNLQYSNHRTNSDHNIGALSSVTSSNAGSVSSAFRFALGNINRMSCELNHQVLYSDFYKFFYTPNRRPSNSWWEYSSTYARWSDAPHNSAGSYPTANHPDCGSTTCDGPGYQGRNWGRTGQYGCGLMGYGRNGLWFVRASSP